MRCFVTTFVLATVAFGAISGLSALAAAQEDVEGALAEAREMILYARYDEAVAAAEALAGRSDLAARQKNAALELLAIAEVASGDQASAAEVLGRLYARDPGHRLSDADASPRVQAAFARAREQAPEQVSVALEQRAPQLEERTSPQVLARVTAGQDAVEEIRLGYRRAGEARFTRVVMNEGDDGTYQVRVPVAGDDPDAYEIEYVIEALAPSRTVLARLGTEISPLTLTVPAVTAANIEHVPVPVEGGGSPETPPEEGGGGGVASKWWFWTLVVLAVGAAVAVPIAVVAASDSGPQGSLGSVELSLIDF